MYENEKKDVLETALKLIECDLIKLSAGNVSVRTGDHVVVTPSGKDYKELTPEDIVVIDLKGNKIEGKNMPSLDSIGLLYIYNNMPEVKAAIHTHQPYSTAISLIADKLPGILTTLINAVGSQVVYVTPFAPAGRIETGIVTVENLKGSRAVILRQHGVMTVGADLTEALYAAVYLEEASKAYLAAKPLGEPRVLTDEQAREAIDIFKDYHK
ncbi:MAG: class II aldolase/adducin family protein [Actinobacteria bacterium]|nr:class II aldolase/adducin family protein [Actinomycetota bacterium]